MTVIATKILLEQLIEEEYQALSWDDKLFKSRSVIKTTGEVSDTTKIPYPLPLKHVIKRRKALQAFGFAIFVSLFTFIFSYILFTKFSTGALIVSVSLLSLMYYVFYKNLTLKDINFKIVLSKEGIEILDKFYLWDEIQETFVIHRPNGKSHIIYFVIGFKNGFVDRYHMNNLFEFNLSERTFAALIETYRH